LARVRADEVREACSLLGLDEGDVVSSSYPDGSAPDRVDDLAALVASEVDRFGPAEVLVASGHDWHPDHQACSQAVRRALAALPAGRRPRLLEYPVWWWVHGPWEADAGGPWAARRPRGFWDGLVAVARSPHADLVSTTGYLAAKGRALRAYRSQLTNLTGEADWATLDDAFVSSFFLPHEVSFEVTLEQED
jgi:LmbE family N-acetylglucosaminyl deacetylase